MDVWSHEERLEVNEMRSLRWMCGVTKKDEEPAMDVWRHEDKIFVLVK